MKYALLTHTFYSNFHVDLSYNHRLQPLHSWQQKLKQVKHVLN